MIIRTITLDQAEQARGVAVVIDVLRAFTTAAFALSRGAREIVLVAGVDEALALQQKLPGALTLGEVHGRPLSEFNFSNSPVEMSRADVRSKRLIHRSSAGTQGAVRARHAQYLLAGAFPCAAATARYIGTLKADEVDLIVTGIHSEADGDEDTAFADYLTELLKGASPAPGPYLERVRASSAGCRFLSGSISYLPAHDVALATAIDRFDFAMPITREDGLLIMRKG